jgi:hypothetical protein
LELVQDGEALYLFDPARGERLLTTLELAERVQRESQRAEAAERRRAAADRRAEREAAARAQAEAEVERPRAELEALRRRNL